MQLSRTDGEDARFGGRPLKLEAVRGREDARLVERERDAVGWLRERSLLERSKAGEILVIGGISHDEPPSGSIWQRANVA